MKLNQKIKGFSLLEMVIVLAILGLLITGIVGPLATRYEQKQRQETQDKLQLIKDALYGFVITNGRIPCPDTNTEGQVGFGSENMTGENCGDVNGTVPFRTLSVNTIKDAWGNSFQYHVSADWADDPAINISASGAADAAGTSPCGNARDNVSFELCSVGDITIQTFIAAGSLVDTIYEIPVVFFSGGKNNFGGTAEDENTNGDATFAYSDYRMVSGSEYDDLMTWISPNVLKYRMVQAGRLP